MYYLNHIVKCCLASQDRHFVMKHSMVVQEAKLSVLLIASSSIEVALDNEIYKYHDRLSFYSKQSETKFTITTCISYWWCSSFLNNNNLGFWDLKDTKNFNNIIILGSVWWPLYITACAEIPKSMQTKLVVDAAASQPLFSPYILFCAEITQVIIL